MRWTKRPTGLCALLSVVIVACGDAPLATPERPRPAELVDHNSWSPARAEPIPLRSHAPEDTRCPSSARRPTADGVLDVDTGACRYLALEQPAQFGLRSGSTLRIRVAHLQLYDPEAHGSVAHVAIALGGTIAWERTIPIPSPARAYDDHIVLSEELRAGDPIHLHLHNHGANEWKIFSLRAVPD